MTGQVGTGAVSYVLTGLEASRGVLPANALDEVLYVTQNSIAATPDVIRKMVMAASRAAERIIRPSKFKIHGTLTHPLTGNSGAPSLMALLGQDTELAAVTGTAYHATTPAGGLMTTFLNTDVLALVPGAWATFNTGANQECRQIFPVPGVTNEWECKALTGPNATTSPTDITTFKQLAQHKFGTIPATSAAVFTLPTQTLELNEGGQWAWRLRGCYVGKGNIKGGKEDVEVQQTIVGTEMPDKLTRPASGNPIPWTAFDPSTEELADVAQLFSINDGFALVPNDALATGTSVFQLLDTLEDWEIDFDNGMLEKPFWDGSQVYKAYPGVQKCTIKYKYATAAGRPDAYEDFLRQLKATPIPFNVSLALNVGTLSTPAWHAAGLYVPSAIMTKADTARSVTDVLTVSVEADALITQADQDLMNIFVVNDTATQYAGS